MTAQLTPWFPGNIKPARPGVYQQAGGADNELLGYQRWDGERWHAWCDNVDAAARQKCPVSPSHQNDPWRGLAQEAEQ